MAVQQEFSCPVCVVKQVRMSASCKTHLNFAFVLLRCQWMHLFLLVSWSNYPCLQTCKSKHSCNTYMSHYAVITVCIPEYHRITPDRQSKERGKYIRGELVICHIHTSFKSSPGHLQLLTYETNMSAPLWWFAVYTWPWFQKLLAEGNVVISSRCKTKSTDLSTTISQTRTEQQHLRAQAVGDMFKSSARLFSSQISVLLQCSSFNVLGG